MTVVLRQNKTQPLSFTEMDGNFSGINGRVSAIEASYVASVNASTGAITLTTAQVPESEINQYYTRSRFDAAFGEKSTNDLAEGSNLYYTQSRFDTRFNSRLAATTTTSLTEGANLYYTTARVDARIASSALSNLSDVSNASPTNEYVLTWSSSQNAWLPLEAPGATGGQANTIITVGAGASLFREKIGVELRLKSLLEGNGITLTENTDDIEIGIVELDGGTY